MHTSHNYIPDFELAKISNLFGKTMPELKIIFLYIWGFKKHKQLKINISLCKFLFFWCCDVLLGMKY